MKNLIQRIHLAAQQYSLCDFAFLKLALIGVGILLGAYFSEFFTTYIVGVWIFTVAFVVCVVRITLKRMKGETPRISSDDELS